MHNRQRRDTESFATLRKRATNSVTAEIIPVRINFCHNRDIRGYATIFGDRPPDAQFAATCGVAIRGVNCSDIAVKDSTHQIDRGLLCDRVAEVLRHAAQRCAAQGDGTHIQTGLPEGVHVPAHYQNLVAAWTSPSASAKSSSPYASPMGSAEAGTVPSNSTAAKPGAENWGSRRDSSARSNEKISSELFPSRRKFISNPRGSLGWGIPAMRRNPSWLKSSVVVRRSVTGSAMWSN